VTNQSTLKRYSLGTGFGDLDTKVYIHVSGGSTPEGKLYPEQPNSGRERKPAPELFGSYSTFYSRAVAIICIACNKVVW
jgi:hypothetical protein